MSGGLSDEFRLEIRRRFQEAHPEADVEGMMGGSLAEPASADRPPVPVWEYLDYQAAHPEISVEQIERIRFPIALYGGETMVTSIFEMTHMIGPPQPSYDFTVVNVVRHYRILHEHGAMSWNASTRTLEETLPRTEYWDAVSEQWRGELKSLTWGT